MDKYKKKVVIGDCTLYLGDCLSVMDDIEESSVDMLWTDPPYGNDNHNGDFNSSLNKARGIESKPIMNDDQDGFRNVLDGMLSRAVSVLKDECCCCCCCCGGGGPKPTFAYVANRMDECGLKFFHSVIWDKKNPGLGWRYRRQHEMIMIAHISGGKLLWNEDMPAARNIYSEMPPKKRSHPNEKPIKMVKSFISNHTRYGHVILDPFMGSGTTLVACAQMGRRGIGIEIDEDYFDIACKRVEEAYSQPDLFIENTGYEKASNYDLFVDGSDEK